MQKAVLSATRGEKEQIMFDSYCRVTPNADQTLLVEYYDLVSDYKSEHVSIFNSDNIYKHFVYCGAEVYDIQGNAKAWQLFYNRFITEMKGKDSFLTEDFSLERIKEEYSASEAICKKRVLSMILLRIANTYGMQSLRVRSPSAKLMSAQIIGIKRGGDAKMYTLSKRKAKAIIILFVIMILIIITLSVKVITSAGIYTITRELQGEKYYITIDTKGTYDRNDDIIKDVKKYYNHIF